MIELTSERDTERLAARVAETLTPGDTVALIGGLGAGKTTFTRYLVGALGGLDAVSSPTYVLEHEYRARAGAVVKHWDLYRLGEAPEELSEPPHTGEIRVIEWADKFPDIVDCADLVLEFTLSCSAEGSRRTVTARGRRAGSLAASL